MPELAALIATASLGAMLFFSAVVAPTTFGVLKEADAGAFLRALFPKYFTVNGALAILAGLIAFQPVVSAALVGAGAVMIAVRFFLIPMINAARDRMVAGDEAAKSEFDRLHRASVVINVIEMAVICYAVYVLIG